MSDSVLIHPFVTAFVVIFIAELGDKTQLLTLGMAARFGALRAAIALTIGASVVSGASSVLGEGLSGVLPGNVLRIASGILLIAFGVVALFAKDDDDDEAGVEVRKSGWLWPVLAGAALFVIAELGDKTMLATIALSAGTGSWVAVWVGAASGMIGANLIGILLVRAFGDRIPERALRIGSAVVFIASGALVLLRPGS